MAGAGRRIFSPGEVLTASNTMNYLMDQAVMNFAGTAARGSAIGTAVAEGMVSYLQDLNQIQVYDGSGWKQLPYTSDVGLVPIIPPTVRFSGGTATANSLGVVSFTNVTSIALDNIFSSSYQNYRILTNLSNTNSGEIRLRFTVNGTASATGYANGAGRAAGNVFDNYSSNNLGYYPLGVHNSGTAVSFGSFIDIYSPNVNSFTAYNAIGSGFDGTNSTTLFGGGSHRVVATNDGVIVYPAAGSATGNIACYGYKS